MRKRLGLFILNILFHSVVLTVLMPLSFDSCFMNMPGIGYHHYGSDSIQNIFHAFQFFRISFIRFRGIQILEYLLLLFYTLINFLNIFYLG